MNGIIVVLILYLIMSQFFYSLASMFSDEYTTCYRCRECGQVHERERMVCTNCGRDHYNKSPYYMIKDIGKWEYRRYPTKILFYKVEQIWRSKNEG